MIIIIMIIIIMIIIIMIMTFSLSYENVEKLSMKVLYLLFFSTNSHIFRFFEFDNKKLIYNFNKKYILHIFNM